MTMTDIPDRSPERTIPESGAYASDFGAALSFDRSKPGRKGVILPPVDVPMAELPDQSLLRDGLRLPEMSQPDIIRYFLGLSRLNYSVDTGFYPLGSCTMKYNPKINEDIARLPGFAQALPQQPEETVQGALAVLAELQDALAEITGMDAVSLAPAAGAQGELSGILMIKKYHLDRGDTKRTKVLVPDSAHGTNPATAAMAGFTVVSVPSDANGNADIDFLAANLDDTVAAMMYTLPSTLGLFDPNIGRVAQLIHEHGALLYGDGANQNAFLGRARFGDMGFDVVHLNLHKTFSTPHGGGGPGAGPVCVKAVLADYLPAPVVVGGSGFSLTRPAKSIGKTMAFHGNFGVLLRALTYIKSMGGEGLRAVSENAVINANYVQSRLRGAYKLAVERNCMHEVVLSGSRQKQRGVKTLDIAKRLIDYGFHPPTIYFPLIVDEAMMIEPTETEGIEALDAFCDAMLAIDREATETPEIVKQAPLNAPLKRLDEATAARKPILRWQPPRMSS
jgi:glycine dehydrogenase subunit 2